MTSLVADYGTSSGSESESNGFDNMVMKENDDTIEDNNSDKDDNEDDKSKIELGISNDIYKLPLPTPNFNKANNSNLKTSVFSNPFVEAEKAKSAILEKHVKMTPTLDHTKMINGKKICWNYRKGRCRFGHNCTFAHDSDLHKNTNELLNIQSRRDNIIYQQNNYSNQMINDDLNEEIDQENNQSLKKKKRPGLTQTLIPGKKVLKIYKAQQAQTVNR